MSILPTAPVRWAGGGGPPHTLSFLASTVAVAGGASSAAAIGGDMDRQPPVALSRFSAVSHIPTAPSLWARRP
jgi:hypothetical protein